MVVVRAIHCALVTNQLFTCLAVVDERAFMMNTISK